MNKRGNTNQEIFLISISHNTIELSESARSESPRMKPLTNITLKIADDMAYLKQMQFVHRD